MPCCASGSAPPACLIATHAPRASSSTLALLGDQRVEPRLELALALAQLVGDRLRRARARSRGSPAVSASSLRSRAASENHDTACCSSSSAFARSASLPAFTLSACAAYAMPRSYAARNRSSGSTPALAARLEQRLLGGLVVALGERRDALVVLLARVAVLAARARGDDEHERATSALHGALRSPAPAPTHSAASRQHERREHEPLDTARPGSRARAASAAARTIGCTWLSMIESRSIALVPAGMYAPSVTSAILRSVVAVELADHRLAVVHQRRLRAGLRIGQRDLGCRSRCRGRPRRS